MNTVRMSEYITFAGKLPSAYAALKTFWWNERLNEAAAYKAIKLHHLLEKLVFIEKEHPS